ncbi:MAG: Swt1 family HEPN domain-containing protein [Longimicrobiales bacterium]
MALTNQERVGKAMDLLRAGLAPFVEREVQAAVASRSVRMDAIRRFAEDPMLAQKPIAQWDSAAKLMWQTWNDVFGQTLGRA